VLLDPFEEQLDLPAALVERGDGQGRQGGVVRQKHQRLVQLLVMEPDASQMLGVALGGVEAV
jgi:hypothetical protein